MALSLLLVILPILYNSVCLKKTYRSKLAFDPSKCAQAGRLNPEPSHGHFLRVFPCVATNAQQQFTLKDDAIVLVEFSWLAVVFQGVKANVNSDRIIVGDLRKRSILPRKDWIILNK